MARYANCVWTHFHVLPRSFEQKSRGTPRECSKWEPACVAEWKQRSSEAQRKRDSERRPTSAGENASILEATQYQSTPKPMFLAAKSSAASSRLANSKLIGIITIEPPISAGKAQIAAVLKGHGQM